MVTVILLICFVLIAIAFLLIILLFQRISSIKDIEKKQSIIIKEMEQIITGYLMEMKEENEVFLNKLLKLEQDTDRPDDESQKKPSAYETLENKKLANRKGFNIEEKEEQQSFDIVEEEISKLDLDNLLPSYENNTNIEEIKVKTEEKRNSALPTGSPLSRDDLYVQSLSAQAMLLQKKGDSVDQIAKKLGKGKTEIELLLKFRQN